MRITSPRTARSSRSTLQSGTSWNLSPWQVWWVNFDPQLGREQAGLRPAVIVSSAMSCRLPNELVYVAPCTTRLRGLAIHPEVDLERPSAVLCDQVKAVDYRRLVRPIDVELTPKKIAEIKRVIRRLIDVG
ncbi:MAG: type II toxin-antitoxin system PemK/MazF family toxin [Sporichthyaceae bacterium]